ncbi:MAG: hypothetical protein ABEJ72_04400 [Candidatus Aenigmatarchaeota archaeon]
MSEILEKVGHEYIREADVKLNRLDDERPDLYSFLLSEYRSVFTGIEKCIENDVKKPSSVHISNKSDSEDVHRSSVGKAMMGLVEMGYVEIFNEPSRGANTYDIQDMSIENLEALGYVLDRRDEPIRTKEDKGGPMRYVEGKGSVEEDRTDRVENIVESGKCLIDGGSFDIEDIGSLDFEIELAGRASEIYDYRESPCLLFDVGIAENRLEKKMNKEKLKVEVPEP